jgi:hypothetical protein
MADLIYVAIIISFFAVAALFVVACDRIIGPEDSTIDVQPQPEKVAA